MKPPRGCDQAVGLIAKWKRVPRPARNERESLKPGFGRRLALGSHPQKERAQQQPDPNIERRLDDELEQTFPASDALQITRDQPAMKHQRRRAKLQREASR